jgi:hypothetical protein
MILKNSQTTLETPSFSVANASLVYSLLKWKIIGLHSGKLIPDKLISDLENFVERNLIVGDKKGSFCPRCLKAHASKKAAELGLDKDSVNFLGKIFKCEEGHNGYYLDSGEVVKIELKGGFSN